MEPTMRTANYRQPWFPGEVKTDKRCKKCGSVVFTMTKELYVFTVIDFTATTQHVVSSPPVDVCSACPPDGRIEA